MSNGAVPPSTGASRQPVCVPPRSAFRRAGSDVEGFPEDSTRSAIWISGHGVEFVLD